jgi:predicted transcriptional regulator
MEELGLSRDAASYYLRELVKEGRLKAGKEGKYTVYHVRRAAK